MSNMNVYIRDRLKKRMDDFKDEEVNWSEVAQRAFEGKVNELSEQKEKDGLKRMIDRLRKTKGEKMEDDERNGRRDGGMWAERQATHAELEALESIDLDEGLIEDFGYFVAEQLVRSEKGAGEYDKSDINAYYEGLFDKRENLSQEYVQGFLDGALEKWEAVKDQV